MRSGKEAAVRNVMERVVHRVRQQPGFVRGDVLRDTGRLELYCILPEWESVKHLDTWLVDKDYVSLMRQVDGLLGAPVKYQILHRPREDLFLL